VTEDREIRDFMATERARGARRPKDPETKRQERDLLEKFRRALELENERNLFRLSVSSDSATTLKS